MKKLLSIFLVGSLLILCGCEEEKAPVEKRKKKVEPKAEMLNQIPKVILEENERPFDQGVKKNAVVKVSTEYGDIEIKLYDETPRHRDNFLELATNGFYNELLFHRVMGNFMIQGGDPNSKEAPKGKSLGSGGPGYTLPAERNPNFIHKKGALSAARLPDNANPTKRSSGSQFYLVQGTAVTDKMLDQNESRIKNFKYTPEQREMYKKEGGYPFLDMEYTVYGEVIKGLDVIDKIAAVETDPRDRPLEDVVMNVSVVRQ